MVCRNTGLVAVAVLIMYTASIHAQEAPGDESQRCLDRADPYPKNVKMLMSSWHYDYLLASNGVWKESNYDNNNHILAFFATKWVQTVGGLCRWNVKSCGTLWGPQDNWLFTQFINKTVPHCIDYPVHMIAKISYSITSCRERLGCFSRIRVHAFLSNGSQPHESTNKTNYEMVGSANKVGVGLKTLVVNIEVPANTAGFYLAVEDDSSCIQISKLEVYRYQCPQKQEGLVMFPENAAPMADSMTVMAECMPNSSPMEDMAMGCDSEGNWAGSTRCQCNPGYFRETVNDADSCKFCRPGFYRSGSDTEYECLSCPANTERNEKAAPICKCRPGYYRNDVGLDELCRDAQQYENASFGCTKPPSAPRNVVVGEMTTTSICISWETPLSLGGRSDVYYEVHYSDPDRVGFMLRSNCNRCLTATSCCIGDLKPATQYAITVSSHNGVSDQDPAVNERVVTIYNATKIPPPSAPIVTVHCCVLVCDNPNDVILGYKIMIGDAMYTVEGDRFFVFPPNVSEGMPIKVSAFNDVGMSTFSYARVPACSGTPMPSPSVTTTTVTVTPARVITTEYVTRTATSTCPTPTPPPCPSCPPPTLCPEITCPSCPAPQQCPSPIERPTPSSSSSTTTTSSSKATTSTAASSTSTQVVPTTSSVHATPTETPTLPPLPPCQHSDRTRPSDISGLVKVNCTTITWDKPTVNGCTDTRMTYRIRLFSGSNYGSSSSKVVLSSLTNSLTFTQNQVNFRPINAIVKARRANGAFSARWSSTIAVQSISGC